VKHALRNWKLRVFPDSFLAAHSRSQPLKNIIVAPAELHVFLDWAENICPALRYCPCEYPPRAIFRPRIPWRTATAPGFASPSLTSQPEIVLAADEKRPFVCGSGPRPPAPPWQSSNLMAVPTFPTDWAEPPRNVLRSPETTRTWGAILTRPGMKHEIRPGWRVSESSFTP